jgi:uncharacterized membrane protein YfcA
MVFMPIASLVYEPRLAAILLFIADDIAALAMLPDAVRRCVWREVLPLGVAAVLAVPFGVALLVVADADVMRWVICCVILLAVGLMAAGWRYTGRLGLPATLGTGALAGLSGGAAALPGPPVVLLWLGGQGNAATVRANLIVFFGFTATATGIAYWWGGLFTQQSLLMSLPLIPAYLLPLNLGSRLFARASDQQFRRAAPGALCLRRFVRPAAVENVLGAKCPGGQCLYLRAASSSARSNSISILLPVPWMRLAITT